MTKKDLIKLAKCLHALEPEIGGDWYEVVRHIGLSFIDEFPKGFDMNEFQRISAGGEP